MLRFPSSHPLPFKCGNFPREMNSAFTVRNSLSRSLANFFLLLSQAYSTRTTYNFWWYYSLNRLQRLRLRWKFEAINREFGNVVCLKTAIRAAQVIFILVHFFLSPGSLAEVVSICTFYSHRIISLVHDSKRCILAVFFWSIAAYF